MTRRELRKQWRDAKRSSEGKKSIVGKILWISLLIIIVGGSIAWFLWSVLSPKPGVKVTIQGREHIAPGAKHEPYTSNPPVSGPHYAERSECGIFEELIPVETLIHNMEHGQVVVYYKPDLAKEEVQKLKDFVMPLLPDGWILMARNEDISSNIALASWGRYQLFDAFNEAAFQAYYKENIKRGPERIPCEYNL